jgi:hypothetical protein
MKYYRLIFFLTVSSIFLPVISSAKQPAGEVRSVPAKENPAVEREPIYLPNENDVKSFVYRWFSWLDHQVADFLFLYHLSQEDLVMKFPETVVRSRADFKKWYQGVKDTIQSNTYEVGDIKVSLLPKGRYKVVLFVRWKAKTYKGESLDVKFKQDWVLGISGSGRLTINRYVVKKTK